MVSRIFRLVFASGLAVACGSMAEDVARSTEEAKPQTTSVTVQPTNPLDAQRAYGYLLELCAIGPRPSGSAGMAKQQALLEEYFKKAGGNVTLQRFLANNPLGGDKVPMANIIVEWHPDRKERILLCTHYDTRPQPDNDPDPVQRRNGRFLGANDGASGVAIFMELAHLMPKLEGPLGVDLVCRSARPILFGCDLVRATVRPQAAGA
jgi:glutaminyl-peptide cyclotransferase